MNYIAVKSFDGTSIGFYYQFSISGMMGGKNEPKCSLVGIKSNNFWGDQSTTLGYYAKTEDAIKEIAEIEQVILLGKTTYELKYCAKAKVKAFGIQLIT